MTGERSEAQARYRHDVGNSASTSQPSAAESERTDPCRIFLHRPSWPTTTPRAETRVLLSCIPERPKTLQERPKLGRRRLGNRNATWAVDFAALNHPPILYVAQASSVSRLQICAQSYAVRKTPRDQRRPEWPNARCIDALAIGLVIARNGAGFV